MQTHIQIPINKYKYTRNFEQSIPATIWAIDMAICGNLRSASGVFLRIWNAFAQIANNICLNRKLYFLQARSILAPIWAICGNLPQDFSSAPNLQRFVQKEYQKQTPPTHFIRIFVCMPVSHKLDIHHMYTAQAKCQRYGAKEKLKVMPLKIPLYFL